MNILQMSISAGVLVIAIVLIRSIALNRLPKKMFLALWGLALFRLVAPISISSPFRVPSILNVLEQLPLSDTGISSIIDNSNNTSEILTGFLRITEVSGAVNNFTEMAQKQASTITLATVVWFAGMIVMFIILAVINNRNHKKLQSAMAIRDNAFLNEWLAEHRLFRPITILISDRILSPLAVGILNPRIILPKSLELDDFQLLNYVLTHEYIHIKRHDALWKMLLLLALCVHWFNPLVWLMFIMASRDLELTCDEAVIRCFGTITKKTYAHILIGMAEQQGKFGPLSIFNGFSKNATEERIVSIMKTKNKSIVSIILAASLVLALSISTLTIFASDTKTEQDVTATVTDDGAITVTSSNLPASEIMELQIEQFSIYSNFGLVYDPQSDQLYFNNELVRYFEDMIPIDEGNAYGIQHFTNSGTVDVHAIRDFTDLTINANGLTDLSGKLLGLKAFSQAEFKARDLEKRENNNAVFYSNAVGIDSMNMGKDFAPNEAVVISSENGEFNVSTAKFRTVNEIFAEFKDYDIIIDSNIESDTFGNIYYQGQLVITLIDNTAEHFLTISSTDKSGSINILILRDDNGNITDIEILQK